MVRCAQEKVYLQNSHESNLNCERRDKEETNKRKHRKSYLCKLESCNQVGLAVSFFLPGMAGPILGLPSALRPAISSPSVIAAACLPVVPRSAGVGIPGSRSTLLPSMCVCIAGAARLRTSGSADVLVPRSRSLFRTSMLLCALLRR